MDFEVKVEGLERIGDATRHVQQEVEKQVKIALFAAAKKVEADAKQAILSGEKTGRTYRRRTVTHRASAPGEAPASDTGRLVNSIHGEAVGSFEAIVRAGGGIVRYARMLEFGTLRMAARPFFHPALEKNRGWIADRLNKAVRTAAINSSKK